MIVRMHNEIVMSLFLIFCGAAVFATLALILRQSLLVAYIVLGALIGPYGFALISDPSIIEESGHIGIVFLLFLLGLNLEPQNLLSMLKQTLLVTIISSTSFGLIGYLVGYFCGFTIIESLVIGTCMMFSSTVIGLKLLPTTVLHHQRLGQIIISILLLQDIIAIFAILLIHGAGSGDGLSLKEFIWVCVGLPGLIVFAFVAEKYLLMPLFKRFSRIHEFVFLVAIGWCLGLGQLAESEYLKLSFEVGAFIAGISIAQSPISRFIAESLKPLRDFFLILFFFSIGASINFLEIQSLWLPIIALAVSAIVLKPLLFKVLILKHARKDSAALEIGVRIGQISEFSLLVAYMAKETQLISVEASTVIQVATIISFMVSSYWIINRYPTPIAVQEELRRD